MENGNGSDFKRWSDRLLGWSIMLVGALSAILWGILWSTVSAAQTKLGVLEGDKRVIEEQLKAIREQLDRIERINKP